MFCSRCNYGAIRATFRRCPQCGGRPQFYQDRLGKEKTPFPPTPSWTGSGNHNGKTARNLLPRERRVKGRIGL